MDTGDLDSGLRLAEVLAAFSLATDLGMGQPMDHVLRSWLIARRLCERLGLGDEQAAGLYYVLVLAWVGRVADTTEVSAWFGDDIAFRGDSYQVDLTGLPMMGFVLSHVGVGAPFLHRVRLAANLVLTGGRAVERGLMAHCLTTTQMAERLSLPAEVCDPLRQVFSDIVTDKLLSEAIVCDVNLWASCIGGAMQRDGYRRGIEDAGLKVATLQENRNTPSSPIPPRARPRPTASKASPS